MFSKVTLLEASNDVGGHAKTWVDKDRGVLGGYPTGCWMSYVGATTGCWMSYVGAKLLDLSWYEHL